MGVILIMPSSAIGFFIIGESPIGSGYATAQIPAGSKRIWGRTYDSSGNPTWVAVTPDTSGSLDNFYLTALAQVIQLQINESPFYANYGIPAQQSIITQVFPDYYAMQIQAQYAAFFAALTISRIPQSNPPLYNVQAVTHKGTILGMSIAT